MQHPPGSKFVSKGWGFERHIVNFEKYCGKELFVVKDKLCSIHSHCKKEETFWVQRGKIGLVYFPVDINYDPQGNIDKYLVSNNWLSQTSHFRIFRLIPRTEMLNSYLVKYVELSAGDSFHIKPFTAHRFYAFEDSSIIEFSTQDFPEDSIKFIPGD